MKFKERFWSNPLYFLALLYIVGFAATGVVLLIIR